MEFLKKIGEKIEESFIPHYTSHHTSGRIIHPNGDPCTNVKVKIFARGERLEKSFTGSNGEFKADYKWPAPDSSKHQLIIRVYAQAFSSNVHGSFGKAKPYALVDEIVVEKEPSVENIGDIEAKIFEFDQSQGVPLYLPPRDKKFEIAKHSPSWLLGAVRDVFSEKVKDFTSKMARLDVQQIQDYYGMNKEISLSEEETINMLLNIFPADFQKGENADEKKVVINWDRFTFSNNSSLLPNATLTLGSKRGQFFIKAIEIQHRGKEKEIYTDKESEEFLDALFEFRSSYYVRTQIVEHLAKGHLIDGLMGQCVLRCLNKNKLKDLLRPHIEYVIQIDTDGKTDIFGKGVLSVTALGDRGTAEVLGATEAGFCYSNIEPKGKVMWEVLTRTIDQFFYEFEKEIVEDWYEIYYLSKLLVEVCPEYSPWDGVEDHSLWADGNEIDDPNFPGRVMIDGKLKAMRPITLSKEGPQEGDIARIKQFSKVLLYYLIYHHQKIHYKQDEFLNLIGGTIAPKTRGRANFGGTTAEDARWIFSIVHTLLALHNDNTIEKNPYHSIYPPLIENLEANREKFKKDGIDISDFQIGTQF